MINTCVISDNKLEIDNKSFTSYSFDFPQLFSGTRSNLATLKHIDTVDADLTACATKRVPASRRPHASLSGSCLLWRSEKSKSVRYVLTPSTISRLRVRRLALVHAICHLTSLTSRFQLLKPAQIYINQIEHTRGSSQMTPTSMCSIQVLPAFLQIAWTIRNQHQPQQTPEQFQHFPVRGKEEEHQEWIGWMQFQREQNLGA